MDEKTVLVVGATGAVGVPTVRALVAAGHHVRALVRSPQRGEVAAEAGAEPVVGDLFDPATVVPHLDGVDAVVNLATRIPAVAKAALPGAWKENDRIRTEGAPALVEAALQAGVPRFVQESIVFAYADGGPAWLDEDAPRDVTTVVASTDASEGATRRFAEQGGSGAAGVVLRFGLFYGPGSEHTESAGRLVRRHLNPVLGASGAYQPSIHLHDAAAAVVAALEVPSGTYNVTDDEPLTKHDYGKAIADALGVKPPRLVPNLVVKAMGKKVDPVARSQRVSNARFKAATRWTPAYPSLREGWEALVATEEVGSRG